MGSYATLYINNHEIYSTKNETDPTVFMLFTENEKQTGQYTHEEYEKDFGDYTWEEYCAEYGSPPEKLRYVTTLSKAKDRLEFMGFTIPKIQKLFDEGINERIKELEARKKTPGWSKNENLLNFIEQEIEILQCLTFDTWKKQFDHILKQNLFKGSHWWNDKRRDISPLIKYMLDGTSDSMYGFPTYDFRVFLRAVADLINIDAEIVYDLSQFNEYEEFDPDEDFCMDARWRLAEDFVINHKVIVLTEGSTDKWALERSLKLLYPHLSEYYSFMDFEGAKIQGGAGTLASTLKAFIGSGIVNRVVAFFDNDTAAQSALRAFQNIDIPLNIKILQYPKIEIAKKYPTLGPQGTTLMDVNGLAGSLEMYFGEDVLRDTYGNFHPVQWRGYDSVINQYQGEILNKSLIQSKFNDKLKACEADYALIDNFDWSGMIAILDALRLAFTNN